MLLTVVIPVYNGGDEIVANVELIRSRVAEGLPSDDLEVIVADRSLPEYLSKSRG